MRNVNTSIRRRSAIRRRQDALACTLCPLNMHPEQCRISYNIPISHMYDLRLVNWRHLRVFDRVKTKAKLLAHLFRNEVPPLFGHTFPTVFIIQASPSQRLFLLDTLDPSVAHLCSLNLLAINSFVAPRIKALFLTNSRDFSERAPVNREE